MARATCCRWALLMVLCQLLTSGPLSATASAAAAAPVGRGLCYVDPATKALMHTNALRAPIVRGGPAPEVLCRLRPAAGKARLQPLCSALQVEVDPDATERCRCSEGHAIQPDNTCKPIAGVVPPSVSELFADAVQNATAALNAAAAAAPVNATDDAQNITDDAQNATAGTGGGDMTAQAFPTLKLYGNWCGPSWPLPGRNPATKDAVDACCRVHDLCYSAQGYDRCACDLAITSCMNVAFLDRKVDAAGKAFAIAASAFFPSASCNCKNGKRVWPVKSAALLCLFNKGA